MFKPVLTYPRFAYFASSLPLRTHNKPGKGAGENFSCINFNRCP